MLGLERNHFSNKTRGSLYYRIFMRSPGAFPHQLRVRQAGCGPTSARSPRGPDVHQGALQRDWGQALGKRKASRPPLEGAECPPCVLGVGWELRHPPATTLSQASLYDAGVRVLGFLSRCGAYSDFSVCQCEDMRS